MVVNLVRCQNDRVTPLTAAADRVPFLSQDSTDLCTFTSSTSVPGTQIDGRFSWRGPFEVCLVLCCVRRATKTRVSFIGPLW